MTNEEQNLFIEMKNMIITSRKLIKELFEVSRTQRQLIDDLLPDSDNPLDDIVIPDSIDSDMFED